MSHLHRFYVPGLDLQGTATHSSPKPDFVSRGGNMESVAVPGPMSGAEVLLPDEEARHALSVARLRDGERVALFDGKGTEAAGAIFQQGKRQARVLIEHVRHEDPPSVNLILAPAWLNRDKPMEEIIRRGTELGVTLFAFWRAQRSQRPVSAENKWQRLAVESCKQSGRLHLPRFAFFDDLASALLSFDGCVLVADVLAQSPGLTLPLSALKSCALLIGPEGDFADTERAAYHGRGALPVSLGKQVLRTEVASVAMATIVLAALGALGTRLAPPSPTLG